MTIRRLLTSTLMCLTLVGGAACSGTDSGASDGQFIVSFGIGEPKLLTPTSATESNAANVLTALFTALVEYDATFRPYKVAAESITSTDNKTWTIKLKPGWTFHNGEPVTSDSYINAWNAGAWGPNAHDGNSFFEKIAGYADLNPTDAKSAPKAKKMSGLVKKDDLTFDVTLNAPYVNFRSMLGYTVFYPLPNAAFADVANNQIAPAFNEAPIGQGPFKMKGVWQHDQLIQTVRFDQYAGSLKPKIDGVDFKIYQQMTTWYQDLLAGQLDIIEQIPLESMGSARQDLGARFRESPNSVIQFLAFPTFDKRYSKVEIRRAISMAIDRDEIIRTLFLDSQTTLRSFVSPIVPGYRANSCGEACTYNPTKAKELFLAAGGPAAIGGKVELAYNIDGGHKPWIDATCNQIRRNLGVDCVPNPQPKFAELLTKVERKEPVGAFRMGWIFDYPAIENYLGPVYTTTGSSNYYGYSNKEFDSLVARGDAAATPEEATKLYQQAEDLLVRDLPVLPLRAGKNMYGFSARLKDVTMDPFQRPEFLKIEPVDTP